MNTRVAVKRVKTELDIKKNTIKKAIDVQAKPVAVDNYPSPIYFKVDICICLDGAILIGGWASSEIPLTIKVNEKTVSVKKINFVRDDVNDHLNLPEGSKSGFALIIEDDFKKSKPEKIALSWEVKAGKEQESTPLVMVGIDELQPYDHLILGPAFFEYLNQVSFNSPEWKKLLPGRSDYLTNCSFASGFLEGVAVCDSINQSVIVGWVMSKPLTRIWLEDEYRNFYSLEAAFRQYRQDVQDSVGAEFSQITQQAGFVARVPSLKQGAQLFLCALNEEGICLLSERVSSTLSENPVIAANWLFAIQSPQSKLLNRFNLVDRPILNQLINQRLTSIQSLPIIERSFGLTPKNPTVSLIIPLYGRYDFVEHQLIEFSRDSWINSHAEIIYVIDDQRIYENFVAESSNLYRLYKVPFKFIWGEENRGFSGANNLGAKNSKGKYLLFLNSDVFPQGPFWLESLIDSLEVNPKIGAVGPRLVFADGSIQHAGMEFQYKDDLNIWVNHHPNIGLDASLDPSKDLTKMQAITGACLLISKDNFERIDGWDGSYLIGDFEDSDLCLKLNQIGLSVAYNPNIQLIHLERQSFKLFGEQNFRTKVMIYNAALHQTRWASMIENLVRNKS